MEMGGKVEQWSRKSHGSENYFETQLLYFCDMFFPDKEERQ